MNIIEIIMSPFIYIIKNILLLSYQITGNYGLAIILLSFSISLLLLPIFILIEKSKKKDDFVKNKMKPLIDEIKRVYKGQERYYYIKTINRQHNYNSLKSLIPILSLLLQIPFFIAAFQFLDGFEPLKGESFLFIKDLSQADGLFGFINFLPILMTVVNLVTAYFYTRNGNTSERKKMYIVAGAFLVLLFNLPAGLVLYWTMNNVFSFLRLFITNKEVFKRNEKHFEFSSFKLDFINLIPKLKRTFLIILVILISSQLYWAFEHSFETFTVRLILSLVISIIAILFYAIFRIYSNNINDRIMKISVKPWVLFSLLFVTVYFYFASKYYFTGINQDISTLAILILFPLQFFSYIFFYNNKHKINSYKFFSLILLGLATTQLFNLVSIIKASNIHIEILNLVLTNGENSHLSFVLAGIVFSFVSLFSFFKFKVIEKKLFKINWQIYFLSVLYIFGLILFWNPLIVYSSFIENFEFPAIKIFTNNYSLFLLTLSIAGILYIIVPKKIKKSFEYIALYLAIVVFLYSTIIPFDVGTLQVNFFSKEDNLAASMLYFIGEATLLLLVGLSIFGLFKKGLHKYIIIGLLILNITISGEALFSTIRSGQFLKIKNTEIANKNKEYKNKITFSKTENNVIYYILDGAQGWYMKDIMKKDTALLKTFDGFVWYPNTIATSNYTYASVPSMIAGPNFTVGNMNKRNDQTITQKITASTEAFYDKIKEQGYFFTGNSLKYSQSDHSRIENYLPTWTKEWNVYLDNNVQNEMWYTRLWENALFSSAPLFLKPKVYNKNKWIVKNNIKNSSELNKYNSVKILPKISDTNCHKKSFIYIHSMFNHAPWDFISEDGEFQRDVHPFVNQQWFMYLFADWIKWMKENDVYDNTKIILVADHGPSWWHYHKGLDKSLPIEWDNEQKVSLMEFLRLNPLLMVKDYNAKGKMHEDWQLMCNNDAYYIAFNNANYFKDSTSRTVTAFYTKWHQDLRKRKKYTNNGIFEVANNVYKLKDWKKIRGIKKERVDIANNDKQKNNAKTTKSNIERERQKIINNIKNDIEWLNKVKSQAKERNISLDSMFILSADYVIDQRKK